MAYLQKPTKPHLSILFFLSITLLVSPNLAQQTPPTPPPRSTNPSFYYNSCAPSRCNNLSLPYPFNFQPLCHPSSLQPLCPTNQSLLLTSPLSTDTFRVLSINFSDPTTTTFLVASDSLFTCGAPVSRPNYASDASVFSLPFNWTAGTHFNCTGSIPSNAIQGLQTAPCLGCNGQDGSNVCYYAPGFVNYPGCEDYHVITPGSGFNASAVGDLRAFLRLGFQLRYVKPLDCRGCENSGGRCGSKPSGPFVCFCSSSVHPLNCSDGMIEDLSTWVNGSGGGGSGLSKGVIAAISASASVLFLVLVALVVILLVRRQKGNFHLNKEISGISPTRYSYSQLKKFTNNFSSKLGEGGFGSVYKGTIHRSGTEVPVAIKMLKKSKQTEKQFMNEVATIGSVHHHNLVCMMGYCVEGDNHALVYEFMEKGSLDKYIYNTKKGRDGEVEDGSKADVKWLSPKQVYSIALETARGILYLHQGCRNRILHCDIKPHNVLLDSNFSAKVADFGLARMIDKDHSHVSLTAAQGTPGYAAPEMWLKTFGPVTDKSDVYSYGMLLLEMVGRRKNYDAEVSDSSQVYFPEWLFSKIEKDEFPSLMKMGDGDDSIEISADDGDVEKALQRMCLVGLWCIQHIPSNRPSMDRVVQMLEGHVEIGIPPHPFPQKTTHSFEGTSQDALV